MNAIPDEQDLRDYPYEPSLIRLRSEIQPPAERTIPDQGTEGACTGFGLAAVINRLLAERGEARTVSPRMLYEIAKKFDEWSGEAYSGSSCRGALRGWHNMGVCAASLAPYEDGEDDWHLSIVQAKDARKTTLGAYYRVRKRLPDYHAALNEVGAVYASARVHDGWEGHNLVDGVIPHWNAAVGGHAFAIVGYNSRGFYIRNSWGPTWGNNGLALWLYEDWLENARDAWVVRLALSTPQIWHLGPSAPPSAPSEGLFSAKPLRAEIVGHFVHIDDGFFHGTGRYHSDIDSVRKTAKLVAESDGYEHLLLYAHGGLNSIADSARRIVAMKEVFKKNRIYPFHFMYDTGLLEELKDVVSRKKPRVDERTRGFFDWTDKRIENMTREVGRAIWREMKRGARCPFEQGMDGTLTIGAFLDALALPGIHAKQVHLAGHSTGAILLAALLKALDGNGEPLIIKSCSLMAPACTHALFDSVYRPLLKDASPLRIDRLAIYGLSEDLEERDTVAGIYRKSLLYLVSNAFEDQKEERILGMQKFRKHLAPLPGSPTFRIEISNGADGYDVKTASTTHGGFDNDRFTMNDILRSILEQTPDRPFTEDDLDY